MYATGWNWAKPNANQLRQTCYSCRMAKPKPDSPAAQAQALSIPARLLLFCVASRTTGSGRASPARQSPPWWSGD